MLWCLFKQNKQLYLCYYRINLSSFMTDGTELIVCNLSHRLNIWGEEQCVQEFWVEFWKETRPVTDTRLWFLSEGKWFNCTWQWLKWCLKWLRFFQTCGVLQKTDHEEGYSCNTAELNTSQALHRPFLYVAKTRALTFGRRSPDSWHRRVYWHTEQM